MPEIIVAEWAQEEFAIKGIGMQFPSFTYPGLGIMLDTIALAG